MSTLPQPLSGLLPSLIPSYTNVQRILSQCPLRIRSALIKCCQAQFVPQMTDTTPLRNILHDTPAFSLDGYRATIWDAVEVIRGLADTPLHSSFIWDLCRSLPLPKHEVDLAKIEGWGKEISLSESLSPPSILNWRSLFDPQYFNEPLHPALPPRRDIAMQIYSSLSRWKRNVSSTTHYPRMTHKNMSRDTARSFEQHFGENWDYSSRPILSQVIWQRIYADTGVQLSGACEIRQKWYPAQAKPRTYFSMGGEAYGDSAFLQDAFTELADCFIPTHHRFRLMPDRIRLKEGQHLFIYDFSAFTSSMHEQKFFVQALANFCSGAPISYMDARHGVITSDLGEVLWQYHDTCVNHPRLSYERESGSERIVTHGLASLLGIFGNLMTCTFAHGAAMAYTVEDLSQINCAGDDGALAEDETNKEGISSMSSALGSYEEWKCFRSDIEGAICLKLPIEQVGLIIRRRIRIIPPNLILIAHMLVEGYSDIRYTWFDEDLTKEKRLTVVGKDLMRFLRSAYRAREALSEEEKADCVKFVREVSRRFNIKTEGSVPGYGGKFFWPYCSPGYELDNSDPLFVLLSYHYTGVVVLPRFETDYSDGRPLMYAGEISCRNSSKHLSFLEKLGFLEKEKETIVLFGSEGFYEIYRSWDASRVGSVVYSYKVIKDVPYRFM
jgi:hypothetical protein